MMSVSGLDEITEEQLRALRKMERKRERAVARECLGYSVDYRKGFRTTITIVVVVHYHYQ